VEHKDATVSRGIAPLTYLLFLLRGPLLVALLLIVLLLDFIIPGSMKEALRYALIDSTYWYQLAVIAVALLLACAAIRFSSEAMIELVAPDLFDHPSIRIMAHALPRVIALLLGFSVAWPMIEIAMDPTALQTDTVRLFQGPVAGFAGRYFDVSSSLDRLYVAQCFAAGVGLFYMAIAAFVALVAKGPHTPGFLTREPFILTRIGFAVFPMLLTVIFAVAVLGIWQNGVADRAVERYASAVIGSLPGTTKPCGPLWQWVYGSVGAPQCGHALRATTQAPSDLSVDIDQKSTEHALRYDGYIKLMVTPGGPVVISTVSPLYIIALVLSLFATCFAARLSTAIFLDLLFPRLGAGGLLARFLRRWLPPAASTGLGAAVAGKLLYLYPWAFGQDPNHPVLYGHEPVIVWLIAATFIAFGVLASLGSGSKYVADGPWQDSPSVGRRFIFAARRLAALDPIWQWLIRAMIVLGLIVFLSFSNLHAVEIPQWIGPVGIILLWGATVTAALFIMTYLSHLARIPFVTILVLSMAVFAGFNINNNHELRMVPNLDPVTHLSTSETPPSVSLVEWLASRGDLEDYDRYPIFLIATEGGGIRAAYFTANVLAALQDRCPAFAQHTFAISGVSGGSLGAGVFAALAADNAHNASQQVCDIYGTSKRRQNVAIARNVLSADLLSPLLGATLFTDAMQRVIPVPIGDFDRARALEYAVEHSWRNVAGNNRMASPGADLYANPAVPNLFLNTTEAGTGQIFPYVTLTVDGLGTPFRDQAQIDGSNLYCEGTPDDPLYASSCLRMPLKDALEKSALQTGVPGLLRLSTAAIASARFPYLTPAAGVDGGGHYVDGGYFENSGTWLINGLLQNLIGQQLCLEPGHEKSSGCQNVQKPADQDPARLAMAQEKAHSAVFILVVIQSEPCTRQFANTRCDEDNVASYDGWEEFLSPLRALLSTRDKRAAYSYDSLGTTTALIEQMEAISGKKLSGNSLQANSTAQCGYTVCAVTLRFLNQKGTDVPLTWLLSAGARYHMDQAVAGLQTADVSRKSPSISATSLKQAGTTDQVLGSYRRILCSLANTKAATTRCTEQETP